MRTVKLPCGCQYEKTSERWARLCEKHLQEWEETQERWRRERATGVSEEPSPTEMDRCPS